MQCAVAMSYAAAITVRTAGPVEHGRPRGSLVSPIFGYDGSHVARTVDTQQALFQTQPK